MAKNNHTADLTNELIFRKYLLNHEQHRNYFEELNMPEYIALHIISETASEETIYSGKTYLKDLSDQMQLSIRQTSKIVAALRDRGLVTWAHDGDGTNGTYAIITETGSQCIHHQEEKLRAFYGRVIEKYGTENMIRLLQMMKELETVMSSELEEMEA